MNAIKPLMPKTTLRDLKELARKRLEESDSNSFPHCEPNSTADIWNKEYVDIQDAIHQTIK